MLGKWSSVGVARVAFPTCWKGGGKGAFGDESAVAFCACGAWLLLCVTAAAVGVASDTWNKQSRLNLFLFVAKEDSAPSQLRL